MELRPYQKEGVHRLIRGSCLLADDVGTGKTVQTVVALRVLKPTTAVIICPLSMIDDWIRTLDAWYPGHGFSTKLTDSKVVTNYEQAVKLADPKWNRKWDIAVFDEAHRVKTIPRKKIEADGTETITCLRSYYCRQIAKNSKVRWLLSATFMMNAVGEVWHPLHLAFPKDFRSYWGFAQEWCETETSTWSKSGIKILPGLQRGKQKKFAKAMAPYMLKRTKADVKLQLPPVTRQVHWLDMTPDQAKLHEDILHEIKVQVEGGKPLTVANVLARTMYARRCAVSPLLVGAEPKAWETSCKYAALNDLLDSLQSHKVVVFSQWSEPLFQFAERHMKRGDKWFLHGQMTERARKSEIAGWKAAKYGPLFATIGAGGVGLTLTEASTAIFLDEPWNPAEIEQAVGRLDRIGQIEPVTVHFLRAKGSIEEVVAGKLHSKRAMVEAINKAISQLIR